MPIVDPYEDVASSEKKSQKQEILRYLAKGKELTQLQALEYFGCCRLAARIKDLRDDGWPVETTMVDVLGRFGWARVAAYTLNIPKEQRRDL